ncbi:MAG: polyprenol monophosphomannose synthase [Myxococcales bacterium]|nr:polyprenol monophosphomannose synthase [Myxococcales bacterium]
MPIEKVLVFTATYDEAANISPLIEDIFRELPSCDMLVVDDNSPDGTGEILDALVHRYPRLSVIHRPRKSGLGSAHRLAVQHAIAGGYDALVTMDADFSHHPRYLPAMLEELEQSDFVTGSRYAPGGSCNYGLARRALSRTANLLARGLLRIPLRETTTAYRGFRRSLLSLLDVESIRSDGYSYMVESIFRVSRATRRMSEFPIAFVDRRAGRSKISQVEIWKGFTTLLRLWLRP